MTTRRKPGPAAARLDDALWQLAKLRRRPRCAEPEDYNLWVSDNQAERQRAAKLCNGCVVLELCFRAAAERSERHHVWGGKDWTPSR
jgi:Transcription factor WhiB